MKLNLVTLLALLCAAAFPSFADKGHHPHKIVPGPKGGRILEKTSPKAEFLLEKDRTVTITFYDDALKPVPASEQVVSLTADAKGGKLKIDFARKGDVLVSQGKLPEGEGYNLLVQFRQTASAKPQNHRFKLETYTCKGCNRLEYACTCDE